MLDCLNFVRIMFVRPLDLDITVLSIFRLPTSPQHNSSTLTFMELTPGGSLGAQLHLRHMYSTSHVRYVSNNIGPVGSKKSCASFILRATSGLYAAAVIAAALPIHT
jgi:hypothetical protein